MPYNTLNIDSWSLFDIFTRDCIYKLEDTGGCCLEINYNLLFLQELVFTASPDSTIRVWGVQTAQCAQIIRAHESPVTGVSLHATGDYLLSSSVDMVS